MVEGGWGVSWRANIHREGQVYWSLGAIVVKTTVVLKKKGAVTFVIARKN